MHVNIVVRATDKSSEADRSQAAQILGGASYFTLNRIAAIREATADTDRPDAIRQHVIDALKQIEDGVAVGPLFTALRSLIRIDDLEHVAAQTLFDWDTTVDTATGIRDRPLAWADPTGNEAPGLVSDRPLALPQTTLLSRD